MSRIDDIEARAKAATEGPWERSRVEVGGAYVISVRTDTMTLTYGALKRDAEFIAHARTDVPDLVAFVRGVEERHKRYTCDDGCCAWCEGCESAWPCPDRQDIDRLNGGA